RALDLELAHVTHVEEPDGAAGRSMLLDDPGELHRHLPTPARHPPRAGGNVLVIERRALERCGHGFSPPPCDRSARPGPARDGLRRAPPRVERRAPAGGAPAPRRPAARTTSVFTPAARSRGAA